MGDGEFEGIVPGLLRDNVRALVRLKPNGRRAAPCRRTLRNTKAVEGVLLCLVFNGCCFPGDRAGASACVAQHFSFAAG